MVVFALPLAVLLGPPPLNIWKEMLISVRDVLMPPRPWSRVSSMGKEAKPWKPAEGKCVRADLLKRLRLGLGAAVAGLGARAPLRHGRHRGERAHAPGGQGACAAGGVMAAAPQLSQSMPSSWRQYTGPIHLNTIGSAHLACLVHDGLFLQTVSKGT